ncbi:MAG: aminodeoxychorismate synthase component I [Legionella sp.]|nr:aminodeoxychorismate synthase component I [Legionella sp.]
MPEFTLFPLNYTHDLAFHYHKLLDLPGFVLLESSDNVRGRYDILSACPYDRVKISAKECATSAAFIELQGKITPLSTGLDLPFQGGAIGFFSYDLACRLAGIKTTPQSELMTMPVMDVGLYDWAIIVDHLLKEVTLFSANTHADTEIIVKDVLSRWLGVARNTRGFELQTAFNPLVSKTLYENAFHAIHADLKRGRCYQVNLTQPFNAYYSGDAWAIYEKIRAKNPVPFGAFMRTDEADILCFSPERFIKREHEKLLTSPIKGTARREADSQKDREQLQKLHDCPKNRAENVMIVDLMRNDFGRIAKPGTINVNALCAVESFPAVHHLVSHIEAQCKDNLSLMDVFSACFPGGSITGAPKLESMRVIAEQEPYARGVYCGNIGYFSRHGCFDTNIAIRTITATPNTLHLAAGGAIVIDSMCEEEYLECFTKIAGILKGLH